MGAILQFLIIILLIDPSYECSLSFNTQIIVQYEYCAHKAFMRLLRLLLARECETYTRTTNLRQSGSSILPIYSILYHKDDILIF